MTTPSVDQRVRDGQVGALPSGAGRIMAYVGCALRGPVNTPVALVSPGDLQTIFGSGTPGRGPQNKMVELGCYEFANGKKPALFVRAQAVSAGTCSAVTRRMRGTCVPTISSSAASPGTAVITGATGGTADIDATGSVVVDGEMRLEFLANATIGATGAYIPYHYSLDGGATWSDTHDLGTGSTITVPENGWGVTIGTGSVVAGEVVTATASAPSPNPVDDFEVAVEISRIVTTAGLSTASGTVGTDSVYYIWSLDDFRTGGDVECALGTATALTFPDNFGSTASASDIGDVTVSLTTGSVYVGDRFTFRTYGPRWNGTTLLAALNSLTNVETQWEQVQLAEAVDDAQSSASAAASTIGVMSTYISSLSSSATGAAQYKWFSCSLRTRVTGETDAQYQSYCTSVRALCNSTHGAVGAGSCKMLSALSGRQYRRGAADPVGAIVQALSEELSCANLLNVPGGLPGVSLTDSNRNLDDHDEALQPGLDDLRFLTLRSWRGRSGAYVTQDRIFAPLGSDFILIPIRRVFNLAQEAIDLALLPKLMAALRSDPRTGYLLEAECGSIDSAVLSSLQAVVMQKPKASAVAFSLSRNDDVRTRTFTGTGRIVSLQYPEKFVIDFGLSRTV